MTPSAEERLEDLIVRLEKAEAGSRELSNHIAENSGWQRDDGRQFVWRSPDQQAFHVCPDFSRSLDAALTLVPEGHRYLISSNWNEMQSRPFIAEVSLPPFDESRISFISQSHNPPLALVIAMLKARAHRSK